MRVLCNYRARPKIGVCTAIWKVGQEYDDDNEYHDDDDNGYHDDDDNEYHDRKKMMMTLK